MMHIVDFDQDQDQDLIERFQRGARQDERHGACEDDVEIVCPYIAILPEESAGENISPIRFKSVDPFSYIDRDIATAMRLGLY